MAPVRLPRILDAADCRVLGMALVLSLGALWLAAMAGLAVRIFLLVSGLWSL